MMSFANDVLLDFTPEKASELCGVSVERMTEFAHAYANAKGSIHSSWQRIVTLWEWCHELSYRLMHYLL